MSSHETSSVGGEDVEATVTVRLTESIEQARPPLDSMYAEGVTLQFSSPSGPLRFEQTLNEVDDERTYHLTPDQTGKATFFLRCEMPKAWP